MREIIFFVASLAGATILTALAVLNPEASLFWTNVLRGGVAVLAICALVLFIDIIRRRWRGFIGCATWYFWPARYGNHSNTSVAELPSEPTATQLPPIAEPEGKTAEKQGKRAEILSKLRNKYQQRIIIDFTPEYLTNLYKDKLTIEGDRAITPYIWNWLLLSGPLDDVSGPNGLFGTRVTFEREFDKPFIHMYFDDLWIKRLHVLTPKQNIFALCQLRGAGSATAIFHHCEVIDQDSGLPFSVP